MNELTKAAAIEREQTIIESVITQRLLAMEDAPIDNVRKIFVQDVTEEMADLDNGRYMTGLYLAVGDTASEQHQGRGILRDMRREAISVLIRRYDANIYAVARDIVEGNEEVRHVA